MSKYENKQNLNGFYSLPSLAFGKSVQPAFRFVAFFLPNETKSEIGKMPTIDPWHISSVNIPNYKFTIETVMYGSSPRIFPTLDFKGLQFRISFEEDEKGTIAYFINWLQRNIIDSQGYYYGPLKNRMGHFVVEVQDRYGSPVLHYIFKNIVFNDASDPTFDYSSTEVIKYDITFVAEIIETWFYKMGNDGIPNMAVNTNSPDYGTNGGSGIG